MYKLKVPIRDKCPTCDGQSCLPVGLVQDNNGKPYMRYANCNTCNGTDTLSSRSIIPMMRRA